MAKKIIKQTLAFVSNFFFLFFFCNKCNFLLFSSFSLSLPPLASVYFPQFLWFVLFAFHIFLEYSLALSLLLSRLLLSSTCLDIKQFNLSLMKQTVTDNSQRLLLLLQLLLLLLLFASRKAEEERGKLFFSFLHFFPARERGKRLYKFEHQQKRRRGEREITFSSELFFSLSRSLFCPSVWVVVCLFNVLISIYEQQQQQQWQRLDFAGGIKWKKGEKAEKRQKKERENRLRHRDGCRQAAEIQTNCGFIEGCIWTQQQLSFSVCLRCCCVRVVFLVHIGSSSSSSSITTLMTWARQLCLEDLVQTK